MLHGTEAEQGAEERSGLIGEVGEGWQGSSQIGARPFRHEEHVVAVPQQPPPRGRAHHPGAAVEAGGRHVRAWTREARGLADLRLRGPSRGRLHNG